MVAPGVGLAVGELVGAPDGVPRPPGEGESVGEVTSRGARGDDAGTRSVGVDRSRPAMTYALNVRVMASAIPPRAHASPFSAFRMESMLGAHPSSAHHARVK